jgi:hypothetical protein
MKNYSYLYVIGEGLLYKQFKRSIVDFWNGQKGTIAPQTGFMSNNFLQSKTIHTI